MIKIQLTDSPAIEFHSTYKSKAFQKSNIFIKLRGYSNGREKKLYPHQEGMGKHQNLIRLVFVLWKIFALVFIEQVQRRRIISICD